MKVLVTGATGYIGSRLVTVLQECGHEVRVLLRHPSDKRWGPEVEQVAGNLAEPTSLREVAQGVDVVCHLGGGMRPSDGDAFLVNVRGTTELMADAIRQHVRRFLFCSAAVVYGDVASPPASEETACQPLPGHAYALSKWEAEQQLQTMAQDGIELVILRIPQVYSAESPSIRRFPQLASLVSGQNRTHFVHREDVVRALTMLMQPAYPPGTYNVADNHPLTVQEAAAMIQKITPHVEPVPEGTSIPPMLKRVMEATLVLDTGKIRGLGFGPQYPSLEEGLSHET